MADGATHATSGAAARVAGALHVAAGVGFAVAQPLLDLVARHPTFLVAHGLDRRDLAILAFGLSLGLPAAAGLLAAAAGALLSGASRALAGAFQLGLVGLLAAAIALPLLGASPRCAARDGAGPALELLGAALVGAGAALAYARLRAVRRFATVLAAGLLVFPAVFLTRDSLSEVGDAPTPPTPAALAVARPAPVVVLVFDALALYALVDEDGGIDAQRYPHFAALARRSHWFRNATTVADKTKAALPALLTGRYPAEDRPPSHAAHPESLFTWLAASHDLNVLEPVTQLCPTELCGRPFGSRGERLLALASDLQVLSLHVLLPDSLAERLPAVDRTWRGFAGGAGAVEPGALRSRGRLDSEWLFGRFLARVGRAPRPALHFLHLPVPHWPYQYLPSGRSYAPVGRHTTRQYGSPERFGDPAFAEAAALQPYLLQVGYCDALLGRLLEKLEREGLLDEALLVVTSDHGISFRAGQHRRLLDASNAGDILPVPLLLKLPQQTAGAVSDRNVELIDVAPAVLDALGAPRPAGLDGHSPLERVAPERRTKWAVTQRVEGRVRFELAPPFALWRETASRLRELFDFTLGPDALFAFGPHRGLVGRPLAALPVTPHWRLSARIEGAEAYRAVDPEAPFVPAFVAGELRAPNLPSAALDVAVAVNGTIRAVTRSFAPRPGAASFEALLPEASLRPGRNDLAVLLVEARGDGLRLHAARTGAGRGYFALRGRDGALAALLASNGRLFPVAAGAVAGAVQRSGRGYSGSTRGDRVLVFAEGRFQSELEPSRAAGGDTGSFRAPLPYAQLADGSFVGLRFVALRGGRAAELAAAEDESPAGSGAVEPAGWESTLVLAQRGGRPGLAGAAGGFAPLRERRSVGRVEAIRSEGDHVHVSGVLEEAAPGALLFLDGELAASGIAASAALADAPRRFRVALPRAWLDGSRDPELRVFAPLPRGGAAELDYAAGLAFPATR